MQPLSSHNVLVSAPDYQNGRKQVETFFANTLLVRYDKIDVNAEKSHCATDNGFIDALENCLIANNDTLEKFINEFAKTGFKSIRDLKSVEHGYPSKLLHIITHFLDGFIGIDTVFYNLIDDSHWLPENTRQAIRENPDHYWLIHLDGYSATPEKVSLV